MKLFSAIKYDFFYDFILIFLIILIYYPILGHPFHDWDDGVYIYKNEKVLKGLTPETIKWAFTTLHFGFYYPLTWLSHALDVTLFGLNPKGHYFTNILFHIFNTLLIFHLFSTITGKIYNSFFLSLVFAIHPLNVETVAWLAERKNLLSTFFLIISFIFYHFYQTKIEKKRLFYILTFLSFLLGLMAKSSIVVLPLLLFIFDYLFYSYTFSIKNLLKNILLKSPFFLLSAVFSFLTIIAQNTINAIVSLEKIPLSQRFGELLLGYYFYLKSYFFPFNLSIFYPHHYGNYSPIIPVMLFIFLVILFFLFLWLTKYNRYFLSGYLFFLISLLPTSGLIQAGLQGYANRYTYFANWGISLITFFGILNFFKKIKRPILIIFSTLIIGYFFPLTKKEVRIFQSDKTLFENVIKVSPDSFLGYLKLGNYYFLIEKNIDKALENYLKASTLNKKEPLIFSNIGYLYLLKKDFINSEIYLNRALELNKGYAEAYFYKGLLNFEKKEYEEAYKNFLKAKELNFDSPFLNDKIQELEYLLKKR